MTISWGVRVQGSYVVRCYDGPSAFAEEALLRERQDYTAQVVVSRDGGETWVLVPWTSTVRASPFPPEKPRRVTPADYLARGRGGGAGVYRLLGLYRRLFGRRADKNGYGYPV